jgi:hypothetical protein
VGGDRFVCSRFLKMLRISATSESLDARFGVGQDWQKDLVAKKWSTDVRIKNRRFFLPYIFLPSLFPDLAGSSQVPGRRASWEIACQTANS